MTEFHAGDIVAGYRLEARLGGGGYGTVWRARKVDSGRIVAIKLLPESNGRDDEARLAADVEVLAASAAARSPHVVKVLDGGIDRVPFVVMEFVTGSSLAEELRQRGHLSQAETVDIGLGVAHALKALNEAGIVHRDVKPSNVMIDRDGVVKLTDFGIAKIVGFDATTLTGELRISIAYAAPEVWEGKAEHRSDLYALGILLFQCLCGQMPFRGGYAELFYHHRTTEADLSLLPHDVAPSLRNLIGGCLSKDPGARPADAASCIAVLEQAKGELPVEVEMPTTKEPERFGPWLKLAPYAERPWTWYARHEQNGEEALVELYFGATAQHGDALRSAVAANSKLTPYGAQRLIQTNRLVLRPDESWPEQPPQPFQFWLACEEPPPNALPQAITASRLLSVLEALTGLIEAARGQGLPLDLTSSKLRLLPDGPIYVHGAGLPGDSMASPEAQALLFLRGLPLARDLHTIVERNERLDDIQKALAILTAVRTGPEPVAPAPVVRRATPSTDRRRWLLPVAAGTIAAGVAMVALATLLLTGSNETPAPPDPTAVPTNPLLARCQTLPFPVPLNTAETECGPLGDIFVVDVSCPRGHACNLEVDESGKVTLGRNTQTLAYIEADGDLMLASEDGSLPQRLDTDGPVTELAWSPDGRYLAYTQSLPVTAPPVSTTPTPEDTPVPTFITRLRVRNVERGADDGIVLASSGVDINQPWLQRHVSSPQWAPDGQSLYFLWSTPDGRADAIYRAFLPIRGSGTDIDFGRLRSAAPLSESILPERLASVALTAADFGIANGHLGRFVVFADHSIYVQVCDGESDALRCGVGRWNGRPSLLRSLQAGTIYGLPIAPPTDGTIIVPLRPADARCPTTCALWRLSKLSLNNPDADTELATQPYALDARFGPPAPRLTLSRAGDSAYAELSNGDLALISLNDGSVVRTLGAGGAPSFWLPPAANAPAPGPTPVTAAFLTPTATPTATATPTPTPTPVRPFRPMLLQLTVRRGGNPLTGATVVALVGGVECQRGTTDGDGRHSMAFPRDGAPTACSDPGALIRFQVNGTALDRTANYSPQASSPIDLLLP